MPRYRVEWEWRTSWVVDAPSAAVARQCAADPVSWAYAYDLAQDPDITVVEGGKARIAKPPDAVAVDGELLAPEDAYEAWLAMVEGDKGRVP